MRRQWFERGLEEITDSVFRVPLPLPIAGLKAVNSYVLLGEGDAIALIDPGVATAESRRSLTTALRSLGRSFADVTDVLVSHLHGDHYGLAIELRREVPFRWWLGEGERRSVEALSDKARKPFETQQALLAESGAAGLELSQRLEDEMATFKIDRSVGAPDCWIGADTSFPASVPGRLTSIATPGHTSGHTVFHLADAGLYFTGDHVLPAITPSIGLEPVAPLNVLATYLSSLRKLVELPDGVLLPAHGAVGASVHARVLDILDHHQRRLELIESYIDEAPSSAFEVASRSTWTRRETPLSSLTAQHMTYAVVETHAHLRELERTGRARAISDGRVVRFSRIDVQTCAFEEHPDMPNSLSTHK
ncbi:MBL fold metallo-hydrolase [Specibacter sp. RAF43]|uniref:MBL fold metallo-hydrolase n=1 Tax=Specibacter sp. RAF43 TaxID=3233057 RepID=UPI003F9ABF88